VAPCRALAGSGWGALLPWPGPPVGNLRGLERNLVMYTIEGTEIVMTVMVDA
jgi:hypothetical protein